MSKRRIQKIVQISAAVTIACAALPLFAGPADAAGALFRAKRTWWFGNSGPWDNGYLIPPAGRKSYQPPAVAYVGNTASNPRFTAPKAFIKNTTLYFACAPGVLWCDWGYYWIKYRYSYWNAKGSFRRQNANAPTTTTTIRFATTMLDPNASPTAMGAPVTPTTTWGGRYDFSRGGSIMIWPGSDRFGGTMRFFQGPNSFFYSINFAAYPPTTRSFPAKPLSQQLGTGIEFEIGEVTSLSVGLLYERTGPAKENGREPLGRVVYLVTRAPYTTGKARVWEPLGNTNTVQTGTGYDNRTAAGLNGIISMVHPRLVHAYSVFVPSTGKPIQMTWSCARLRKIDFRFLPEPAGVGMLAVGLLALAGLCRFGGR
jgi:hypothetical protein